MTFKQRTKFGEFQWDPFSMLSAVLFHVWISKTEVGVGPAPIGLDDQTSLSTILSPGASAQLSVNFESFGKRERKN